MSDIRTYKFRSVGELVQALDQAVVQGRSDRHVFDYRVIDQGFTMGTLVVNHDKREVSLEI